MLTRITGQSVPAAEGGYPAPRPRNGPAAPVVTEAYGRQSGTNGEVTLGDADAVVITLDGEPDLIRLTARTNGALVTLADLSGREDRPIAVLPNSSIEVRLPRRVVIGRNLVAGSNAALSVVAFFAREREPFNR